ncbi:hypothetical protein CYMTET_21984 [Cymbomonas tetramitiformis]|uniref:Uncharacterized protein n=1 Tax=Cymbomonas tetramitiformis TaxID=36881 RepID=A0AAE0G1R1_9CHLO|nr:hypothetical protein CYMTET_21984 [Cymbomonas tetramitiformis]
MSSRERGSEELALTRGQGMVRAGWGWLRVGVRQIAEDEQSELVNQTCSQCAEGAVCKHSLMRGVAGYWRRSTSEAHFYSCDPEDICLGEIGEDTFDQATLLEAHIRTGRVEVDAGEQVGTCREGHKGVLCGACQQEWMVDEEGYCVECVGSRLARSITAAFMALLTIVLVAAWLQRPFFWDVERKVKHRVLADAVSLGRNARRMSIAQLKGLRKGLQQAKSETHKGMCMPRLSAKQLFSSDSDDDAFGGSEEREEGEEYIPMDRIVSGCLEKVEKGIRSMEEDCRAGLGVDDDEGAGTSEAKVYRYVAADVAEDVVRAERVIQLYGERRETEGETDPGPICEGGIIDIKSSPPVVGRSSDNQTAGGERYPDRVSTFSDEDDRVQEQAEDEEREEEEGSARGRWAEASGRREVEGGTFKGSGSASGKRPGVGFRQRKHSVMTVVQDRGKVTGAQNFSSNPQGAAKEGASNSSNDVHSMLSILRQLTNAFISLSQLLASFSDAYNIPWPSGFARVLQQMNLLNFSVLGIPFLPNAGCDLADVGFIGMHVAYVLLPIVAILLITTIATFSYFYMQPRSRRHVANTTQYRFFAIRTALLILYISYIAISTRMLSYFNCTRVYDEWYLVADHSVQCWVGAHSRLTPLAALGVLLYPIGLPAIFIYLLVRYNVPGLSRIKQRAGLLHAARTRLDPPFSLRTLSLDPLLHLETISPKDLHALMAQAELVDAFASSARPSSAAKADVSQRTSSTILNSLPHSKQTSALFAKRRDGEAALAKGSNDAMPLADAVAEGGADANFLADREALIDQLGRWILRRHGIVRTTMWVYWDRSDINTRKSCMRGRQGVAEKRALLCAGFIFEWYHVEMWWYEISDLFRKLFLTCSAVFFGAGSMSQLGVAVMICFTAVCVNLSLHPSVVPVVHVFTTMTLLLLFYALMIGIVLQCMDGEVNTVLVDHLLLWPTLIVYMAFFVCIASQLGVLAMMRAFLQGSWRHLSLVAHRYYSHFQSVFKTWPPKSLLLRASQEADTPHFACANHAHVMKSVTFKGADLPHSCSSIIQQEEPKVQGRERKHSIAMADFSEFGSLETKMTSYASPGHVHYNPLYHSEKAAAPK